MKSARLWIIYAILALPAAFFAVYWTNTQPNYTDAYYHFNAAVRLAKGDGLVDDYLWTYIGAPDAIPAPSHLYWMPGTSLIAAAGMWLFNASGQYAAAQLGLALSLWGASLAGVWLGSYFTQSARGAFLAGLLTILGGFFMRFWGVVDTFAPYALVGVWSLIAMGQSIRLTQSAWRWWILAGLLAGAGHLIRNDGLLLLMVGWVVLFWPFGSTSQRTTEFIWRRRFLFAAVFTLSYFIVMLPWFMRNLEVIGTALPIGGTQAIWFTQYDDLFSYPADASSGILSTQLNQWLAVRLEALGPNLGTFFAVEGMIVVAPLALVAWWRRRRDPILSGAFWFALGIHTAFTLVFPLPGVRGGLLHAVTPLVPFWAALGLAGLEDVVDWVASRRRRWKKQQALTIFTAGLMLIVAAMSLTIAGANRANGGEPPMYAALIEQLPDDARVMINDVAALYYYTGLGGITVPNADPSVIPVLAERYGIMYLVLEEGGIPAPMAFSPEDRPSFLKPLPFEIPGVHLYAIEALAS